MTIDPETLKLAREIVARGVSTTEDGLAFLGRAWCDTKLILDEQVVSLATALVAAHEEIERMRAVCKCATSWGEIDALLDPASDR